MSAVERDMPESRQDAIPAAKYALKGALALVWGESVFREFDDALV